jgi:hypothetical protein
MNTIYPVLTKPRFKTSGFVPLYRTGLLKAVKPLAEIYQIEGQPIRKSLTAPIDNQTFIQPMKQCFMANPRLSPGSRVMISILAGWGGQGRPLETTMKAIGRNIGRSSRQVFRYLKDAMEEGYLFYARTKDRIGYYRGIKIWLNLAAIFQSKGAQNKYKKKNSAETRDMTHMSETNKTNILNDISDDDLRLALARMEE